MTQCAYKYCNKEVASWPPSIFCCHECREKDYKIRSMRKCMICDTEIGESIDDN